MAFIVQKISHYKKCAFVSVCCLCVVVSFFCSPFSTQFEEIKPDEIRLLDFVYRNASDSTLAEAKPGDTVLLYAYFAGEKVTTIDWTVSFDVMTSINGLDTALSIQPLSYTPIQVPQQNFSEKTYAFGLKFVIPPTILYSSTQLKNNNSVFTKTTGLTIPQVLGLFDQLVTVDQSEWPKIPGIEPLNFYLGSKTTFSLLLRYLTVKIRLNATVNNGSYFVTSDYTVRYNGFFQKYKLSYGNHNPTVNFISLCKVKSKMTGSFSLNKLTPVDTTYVLFLRNQTIIDTTLIKAPYLLTDTIPVDTSCRYFLVSDTGVYNAQSQLDTCLTQGGKLVDETLFTEWFYQIDKKEAEGLNANDLPRVISSPSIASSFIPPLSRKITYMTLWLQLYDSYEGEIYRPTASILREKKLFFRY